MRRFRQHKRRALLDLVVCAASVAGMAAFDGPVGGPLGFASFVVFCDAGYDLAMIATDDNWM